MAKHIINSHPLFKIQILTILLLLTFETLGQQKENFLIKDYNTLVNYVAAQTDPHVFSKEDHEMWSYFLNKQHASVATIRQYMKESSKEFRVPVEILEAIAFVENNWTHVGPSIDRGWGIMHLVDNHYANTLQEAAEFIQLNKDRLKENPKDNIRGMAALLRKYQNEINEEPKGIEDWFQAVKKSTGLINSDLREAQAYRYFELLNTGAKSKNLWNETIEIKVHKNDLSLLLNPNNNFLFPLETTKSLDYPPAISNFTDCNFAEGRNHEIDAWVNHWIGVGTYAGAISWFHNCDAEVSAHFVIRSADGEITQVVSVQNTAWHCGASGYPYNNSRSIGVEHEATLSNPELWNSMPMLEASATMAAYFCDEFGIPKIKDLPGINGHNDMPGTNTLCPGNLPWFTWMSLLDENYAEADLVIMDLWTFPESPDTNSPTELFVEIKNVGNADTDSIHIDYRIDDQIIGFDSLDFLASEDSYILSLDNFVFQTEGNHDYCVYIDGVSNESNILNNSYCIDMLVNDPASTLDIKNNELKISPNPTQGYIYISSSEFIIKSIEIFSLQGKLIEKLQSEDFSSININHFKNGTYIIKITNNDGTNVNKVIIKM